MMSNLRILMVSVDPPLVRAFARCANELGHEACAAAPGAAASTAAGPSPDLAVVDLGLGPEADDAVRAVHEIRCRFDIPVLYVADSTDDARLRPAIERAPSGYLLKPVDARQLRLSIDAALTAHGRARNLEARAGRSAPPPAARPRRDEKEDDAFYAALLEPLLDLSSEGIIITDAAGRFVKHNLTEIEMRGYGLAGDDFRRDTMEAWNSAFDLFEADGETPLALDDTPSVRVLRGQPWDSHLVLRDKTSRDSRSGAAARATYDTYHIRSVARPIVDAAGRQSGAALVLSDVTKLVTAEDRLQHAVAELHRHVQISDAIVESMSDGVVVVDCAMRVIRFNPSAECIGLGMTDALEAVDRPDIHGVFYADRVTPVAPAEAPLARAVRGEAVEGAELFIRNPTVPDGAFISMNATPLRDEGGELVGGVAVFRDVTQQVVEREALLRAFDRGRSDIIETVIHDIGNAINSVAVGVDTVRERLTDNTPLTRFRALADLLATHEDDWASWLTTEPSGRKMLPYLLSLIGDVASQNDGITKTVDRVQNRVRYITDIILTQNTPASGPARRTRVELRSSINAALESLQDSLREHRIAIKVNSARAPVEIVVQARRFQQMLVDLIRNSIQAIDDERARRRRFRVAGEAAPPAEPQILIVARRQGDHLEIEVSDDGIGIEPQHVQGVFEAGYTTKKGASGLGLHSAANFVNGAGGRIQAMSPGIGRGSTVRVALPLVPERSGGSGH